MAVHPSITTNLEFAIEADQSDLWQSTAESTAAGVGDPLGRIDDQSTNDYDADQTTTANKPTVQDGYIDFDGSNDSLVSATFSGTFTTFTLYVVFELVDTGGGENPLVELNDGDTADRFLIGTRDFGAGEQLRTYSTAAGANRGDATSIFIDPGDRHIVTCKKYSTNQMTVYLDDGSSYSFAASQLTTSYDRVYIGTDADGSDYGEVNIIAVYLYDAIHNDTDRGTIEGDLESAYLASDLSLEPNAASLTLTPQSTTIANDSGQGLSPDNASITFTPQSATIANDSTQGLSPDNASITLTPQNTTIALDGLSLEPDAASLTLTPQSTTVANDSGQDLSPDSATLTFTAQSVTIALDGLSLEPDAATLTLTPQNTTVANDSGQGLSPDNASITFTVQSATIANDSGQGLSPDNASLTFTVQEPTIALESLSLEPDAATLTFTVQEPTIANDSGQSLSPDNASITLTPLSATVANGSAQGLSPDNATLTLTPGSVTIANNQPDDFNVIVSTLTELSPIVATLTELSPIVATLEDGEDGLPNFIGTSKPYQSTFTVDGTLTDADSISATLWNGSSESSLTPTNTATGTYETRVTFSVAGPHKLRIEATIGSDIEIKELPIWVEGSIFD